jgi:hypothetical protein
MKWTKDDVLRVRAILDLIASKTDGGKAGFSRELGLEDRRRLDNWRRRGRVPQEHHAAVIAAAAPEMVVTPAMLDPAVRAVVAHLNAMPVRVSDLKEKVNG